MSISPDILELKRTRSTMEEQLFAKQAESSFATYKQLKTRFESDLSDERDQLLCQCAALMALAYLQRNDLIKS